MKRSFDNVAIDLTQEDAAPVAPPPTNPSTTPTLPRFLSATSSSLEKGKATEAVAGLKYVPSFLSVQDEKALITFIDSQPWNAQLSRRTQHYGYEYNYTKSNLSASSTKVGPIEGLLKDLSERLVSEGFLPSLPNQAIINGTTTDDLLLSISSFMPS